MKVRTFMGKVSMEGLDQMDIQVNRWMDKNNIEPIHIRQCFGSDQHHDGRNMEPIIIMSVFYEDE